jgi:organic radical activating enzyme
MMQFKKKWKRIFRAIKKRILRRSLFDGKVRAYLTLRCNLKCDFCVNTYVDGGRSLQNYQLLSASQWIYILNSLDRDIVITGGEPLLYPGLGEIVLGVNPELDITIYSNLMVPLKGNLLWLRRKGLAMYISYHPSYGDDHVFIENVRILKQHKVPFTLHAIDVMGREKLEAICAERLKDGIPHITIDEDQRNLFEASSKKFKKRVRCQRSIILIAPDGMRYQCVSRMVRRVEPLENLLNEPFTAVCRTVICGDYGYCAPCDGLGETRQQPAAGRDKGIEKKRKLDSQ